MVRRLPVNPWCHVPVGPWFRVGALRLITPIRYRAAHALWGMTETHGNRGEVPTNAQGGNGGLLVVVFENSRCGYLSESGSELRVGGGW